MENKYFFYFYHFPRYDKKMYVKITMDKRVRKIYNRHVLKNKMCPVRNGDKQPGPEAVNRQIADPWHMYSVSIEVLGYAASSSQQSIYHQWWWSMLASPTSLFQSIWHQVQLALPGLTRKQKTFQCQKIFCIHQGYVRNLQNNCFS